MSEQLLQRLRTFLQAHGLLRPDARLVVAVSGGPDSLCLLHLLLRLQPQGGPQLHVAHLDHSFRGPASLADAAFVADLAAGWGLPATVERRPVPALARSWRLGAPAAARRVRYAFLAEVAQAQGAAAVAVAHQADDQAETVLLHALRGAGPAGLRGMREAVPWAEWAEQQKEAPAEQSGISASVPVLLCSLIRPLLATPRAAILAYCAAQGLEPRDDPTNRAARYARARVRHQLLPALARHNPQVVAALGRSARICADDYDYIQGQLAAVWPQLADERRGAIRLRREVWDELHPALQRYALRRAAALLGQVEPSLDQIEAARAAAATPGQRSPLGRGLLLDFDQAGLSLGSPAAPVPLDGPQLAAEMLALPNASPAARLPVAHFSDRGASPDPIAQSSERPTARPGGVAIPLGDGWVWRVQPTAPPVISRWWVALDSSALDGPLLLRRRRPGDRFRPLGGRGSRRLQDFFVDVRLPRPLRDAWPILATPAAIIWVAGLRADARFSATATSQATIWVGVVLSDE